MPASSTQTRSILLVEDDRDYCHLLHEAFAEAGFRTLQAENGQTALLLLRNEPVDLVVSDFIMPELNGLELCRVLNSDLQLSGVKVVLYSCNADAAFRTRARELGALEYLPKTDDPNELVRQICEVAGLDSHKQPGAIPSDGRGQQTGLLQSISSDARELRVLFDSLSDFVQIAAQAEPPAPAARLALEAVERTGGEIKRLLQRLEQRIEEWSAAVAIPAATRT